MSYSVTGSGHGPDTAQVQDAFRAFVDALDEATPEDGTPFNGSVSGSENSMAFTLHAEQVRADRSTAEEGEPAEGDGA